MTPKQKARKLHDEARRLAAAGRTDEAEVKAAQALLLLDRTPQHKHAPLGDTGGFQGLDLDAPIGTKAGYRPPNTAEAKAFEAYIRGEGMERKDLSVGTDGVLAPEEWSRYVVQAQSQPTNLRRYCHVERTGAKQKHVPTLGQMQAYVVAEGAASTQDDPDSGEVVFTPVKHIAFTKLTEELVSDEGVNLQARLGQLAGEAIAVKEQDGFVNGTGPDGASEGFLTAKQSDGTTDLVTRVPTAGLGSLSADDLIELFFAVPAQHRANGRFVLSSGIASTVRQLKANGEYIWDIQDGGLFILGRPATIVEDMPGTVASGNDVVAYADWQSFYGIVDRDRLAVNVLAEKYLDTEGKIGYRFKARTQGRVLHADAGRILQVA